MKIVFTVWKEGLGIEMKTEGNLWHFNLILIKELV